MKHTNRDNAAAMDADHAADPYDVTLRAGWCRRCDQPCAWIEDDRTGETESAGQELRRRALAGETGP